jgi:hypothetical protein
MHITNNKELELAILELKEKEAGQKTELIAHFHRVAETLRPANLIKNAFSDLGDSVDLTDSAIGLAAGSLFEKLIMGRSPGLLRKAIGGLLSIAFTNIAIKNAGYIKTACLCLLEEAISFFQGLNKSNQ